MPASFDDEISGVAALGDPVRRSLYDFVARSDGAVSREQAATGIGVQRGIAAFHLDKLADQGLLAVEYRRLTGRTGPGAGRPAKLYRRAEREIAVSLPPREYDLAGRLLAHAIADAESSGSSAREELQRGAFTFGRSMGEEALALAGRRASKAKRREALLEVLRSHGFEPRQDGPDVVLGNCPFHALAQELTDLVCGMNLELLQGVRDALDLGPGDLEPRLEPQPGQCCVKFRGRA